MRAPRFAAPRLPLFLAFLAACGGAAAPPLPAVDIPPAAQPHADPADAPNAVPGPIPVTRADPTLGNPTAPVTLVIFGDLEDSFYRTVAGTLRALAEREGPARIRIAFKHLPMPWHPHARDAALAAAAVLEAGGSEAFWRFHDALLAAADRSPARYEDQAIAAGVPRDAYRRAIAGPGPARKVALDADLAATLHATSSPWIFVNGAPCAARNRCIAADPGKDASLTQLIETERKLARASLDAGTPPGELYAARCLDNLAHPPAPPPDPTPSTAVTEGRQLFGAKHLLVMYKGSRRAPAHITRTRDEARARAEEARKKAKAGARFEDIVTRYSDEPGAASRGGDLGKFPKNAMVPEFQAAVEATKVGEISPVVETPFGFHVILRTE